MDPVTPQDFSAASFTTSTNASLSTPTQASTLRKGGYILIKTHPCKISSLSTSKPGKHGHAKLSLEAYDIFTHKKYEELSPAHANVEVPVVTKREFLVLLVEREGGWLSLWDREKGETKDDLKVPEGEVGERIERLWRGEEGEVFVTVLGAMGREMVVDCSVVERD
ncbi:MAG: Eukaryotic translation initiation factor 5A [Heterodermia speciosa]|uniref:Eukaryotic translation initiation factor 5A n=1 Tax=Heterodermia speciosa TaxID=116794 RepID=A0A8H3FZS0_9LECA|nr:MAG: Eukaryotic translation initiation factor 5A [Heterodermia speciosa]